jgi:hypothetical protein
MQNVRKNREAEGIRKNEEEREGRDGFLSPFMGRTDGDQSLFLKKFPSFLENREIPPPNKHEILKSCC